MTEYTQVVQPYNNDPFTGNLSTPIRILALPEPLLVIFPPTAKALLLSYED